MNHPLSPRLKWRKLNLGCGRDHRAGYVNIDMLAEQGPDVVADVLDLRDFPSRYYEEIIAQDILEHFKRIDTRRALYEWNRLLTTGGTLFVRTTYLNGLIHRLDNPRFQSVEGQELLVLNLFSTQGCEGDFHLTAFTERLLRFYLWECGFDIEQLRVRDQWLFECLARKARDCSFEELIHGAPDHATFVTRAYQEVLFRPPDEVGFSHFCRELREGRLTRRDVVLYFLLSDERKRSMSARAPEFPRECGARAAA